MASPDSLSAIYDGIKRGIIVCMDADCWGSAMVLLFSGIDTIAWLASPAAQESATKSAFIEWCDRYVRLPGSQQLSGLELYSARCAVVHVYGSESNITRDGKARQVAFMDVSVPEVRYDPKVDPSVVLVSISAMAKAFFAGIDKCLVDVFADPVRAAAAEKRLTKLLTQYPITNR
jgi:hypothetical protein